MVTIIFMEHFQFYCIHVASVRFDKFCVVTVEIMLHFRDWKNERIRYPSLGKGQVVALTCN